MIQLEQSRAGTFPDDLSPTVTDKGEKFVVERLLRKEMTRGAQLEWKGFGDTT